MKRWVVAVVMLVLVIALGYPLTMVGIILASPQPLYIGTGSLSSCPPTPNCVSSLSADQDQYIAPIPYTGEAESAQSLLVATLASLPRMTVYEHSGPYIHAVRRTPIMRFVDDLEFVFDDEQKVIHVRAQARLGQDDLDQNRLHVEEVRDRFTDVLPMPVSDN